MQSIVRSRKINDDSNERNKLLSHGGRNNVRVRERFDKKEMDSLESLDFKTIDNKPLRMHWESLGDRGDVPKVITKWGVHLAIGILIGLLAFGIRKSVELLEDLKYFLVTYCIYLEL